MEEIKEKAAKRVLVKEEWTRQFAEYRTPFTGSDVQDIHIAKRAGRYISIAFVRMAEGGTMITIMNRDKNMDTQEIAVDFQLTKTVSFGQTFALAKENKIVFWKPDSIIAEDGFFQPCQVMANIMDVTYDTSNPSYIYALTDANTLV